MAKPISQRVHDSFSSSSSADLRRYEDKIFSSWQEVSRSLSRSVLLIFTLITVFELLAYQTASHGFTIGPLSFARTSTIQIFLPAVVSYLIYDGSRLTLRRMDLQTVYVATIRIYASAISQNDLDILVAPWLPSFWAIGKRASARNVDRGREVCYLGDYMARATVHSYSPHLRMPGILHAIR
jgi:hypothetical protein